MKILRLIFNFIFGKEIVYMVFGLTWVICAGSVFGLNFPEVVYKTMFWAIFIVGLMVIVGVLALIAGEGDGPKRGI